MFDRFLIEKRLLKNSSNDRLVEIFHTASSRTREIILELLMARHSSILRYSAQRIGIASQQPWDDDLTSEAFFVLENAIKRFNPYKGAIFSTWLRILLNARVADEARRKRPILASIDDVQSDGFGSLAQPDEADPAHLFEWTMQFNRFWDDLDEKCRITYKKYTHDGRSCQEIAKDLKVSNAMITYHKGKIARAAQKYDVDQIPVSAVVGIFLKILAQSPDLLANEHFDEVKK